jgi:hypothetical protein
MKSPRMFPDADLCRTRHVNGNVYRCLAGDAWRCPHNLAFAYNFYCNHVDNRQFAVKGVCELSARVVNDVNEPWQPYTCAAGS